MATQRFNKMACHIARSLERVGEWRSILIIRDALHGFTRFDQFQKSLYIAPNNAAAPLNTLVAAGVLGRRRYSQRHRATNIVSLTSGAIFARCSSRWLRWATGTSLPRAQAYCSLTKYRSRSS